MTTDAPQPPTRRPSASAPAPASVSASPSATVSASPSAPPPASVSSDVTHAHVLIRSGGPLRLAAGAPAPAGTVRLSHTDSTGLALSVWPDGATPSVLEEHQIPAMPVERSGETRRVLAACLKCCWSDLSVDPWPGIPAPAELVLDTYRALIGRSDDLMRNWAIGALRRMHDSAWVVFTDGVVMLGPRCATWPVEAHAQLKELVRRLPEPQPLAGALPYSPPAETPPAPDTTDSTSAAPVETTTAANATEPTTGITEPATDTTPTVELTAQPAVTTEPTVATERAAPTIATEPTTEPPAEPTDVPPPSSGAASASRGTAEPGAHVAAKPATETTDAAEPPISPPPGAASPSRGTAEPGAASASRGTAEAGAAQPPPLPPGSFLGGRVEGGESAAFDDILDSYDERSRAELVAAFMAVENAAEPVQEARFAALRDPALRKALSDMLARRGRVLIPHRERWTTGYDDRWSATTLGESERAVLTLVLVHSVAIPRAEGVLPEDTWLSPHPTPAEELRRHTQVPIGELESALRTLRHAGLLATVKSGEEAGGYVPGPQFHRLTPAARRRLQEELILAAGPQTPLAAAVRARRSAAR